MATFLMHPFFGASAAYVVSRGRTVPGQFVVLSAMCQLFVLMQLLCAPHAQPSTQVSTRMEFLQGPRSFK